MGAATATCGTVQEPLALTLKDVKPAAGTSLPNQDITQTFTIVGQHLELQTSFSFGATHTAGTLAPVTWTLSFSGNDSVYTSAPIEWPTAPAHVELNPHALLATDDGCVSELPTPVFSYDITAP